MIDRWRQGARAARRDAYALYLACHDPRVPWYSKALVGAVLAYALSPIDLIPDFIPVVGYLDDAIIVPVGLMLARRMIPEAVFAEHREAAATRLAAGAPTSRTGAAIVVAILAAMLSATVVIVRRYVL